ncbi:MAG: cytochrome c biogenesis protein CcsA [Bacteroidota bacterium]
MNRILLRLSPVLKALLNTRAAGVYILLFALAIGVATFIENDFGTSSAQKVIYKAWWFELLLGLFCGSLVYNIIKFRMVKQKKWALLMFHLSMIVIILGAAVTRYSGFEGIMHIRENAQSNRFLSADSHLVFQARKDGKTYDFDEPVLFATLGNNHWQESYLIDGSQIDVEVKGFIPNPQPVLVEKPDGNPILKIVVGGAGGREEYFLEAGRSKRIHNVIYNFSDAPMKGAFNISFHDQKLTFTADRTYTQMVMATREIDTLPPGPARPLRFRSLYSDGRNSFVFSEFLEKGVAMIQAEDPKVRNESITALHMKISSGGQSKETYVYGRKGSPGRSQQLDFEDLSFSVAYGAKELELPFSIHLNDFIMDRYPGTNSPVSFASEVQLIDQREQLQMDYRIYMNNILNHDGYRFFQSSYDRDEQGTYLSVNHDFWGTWISYLGYALLTLGLLMTFVSKKTRFYQVNQKLKKLREKGLTPSVFMLLMLSVVLVKAEGEKIQAEHVVSKEHAEKVSRMVVQDFRGRMKPIHTLSREILRKVSRQESLDGLSADQVLLSMFANGRNWYKIPMIKLGRHKDLLALVGVEGKYASYADFYHQNGRYKLGPEIQRINALPQADRGVYAKEMLKVDERVNIMGMVFGGSIIKIIPKENDPGQTWLGNHIHRQNDGHQDDNPVVDRFFSAYRSALLQGMQKGDYSLANQLIDELSAYQKRIDSDNVPSDVKLSAEIQLNESRIFNRLTGLYLFLSLGFLGLLFTSVFRPALNLTKVFYVLAGLAGIGFLLHTLGLGIRWYVSGRAPWSNGYESMIYIAWTTTLAGMLFARKSYGGLAATMTLAATILFVATLSFLDPEITPLVPVLRSYWLTIHVSMEAGSYGFLMLGAVMGLINLILMAVVRKSNHLRVNRIVQEMTYLSELTLLAGLVMISIGTYLGGVWANESWGRYWGWDAKETWALVSILVYAFILHMRIIPKAFGLFAYNLATIFGLTSIIMTYYGVNYYLSGLHSYAAGDPVPIPSWVYIFAGSVAVLGGFAYVRTRKFPLKILG